MKQEIYMAREIETKCIHLEEEENSIRFFIRACQETPRLATAPLK